MTKKNAQKVVVIDHIKSEMIDRAIFILKPPALAADNSSAVVREAQKIIDSYIERVEKNTAKIRKKQIWRHRRMRIRQISVSLLAMGAIIAASCLAGYLLNTFL